VERTPGRVLHEAVEAAPRQVGDTHACRQLAHGRRVEAGQPDPVDAVLVHEAGQPGGEHRLGAAHEEGQKRVCSQPAQGEGEGGQGRGVAPVEVIDDKGHGAAGRPGADQVDER
jgi:hypothetical protein